MTVYPNANHTKLSTETVIIEALRKNKEFNPDNHNGRSHSQKEKGTKIKNTDFLKQ